ncbi:MAG: hypothetical protein L3K13_03085, partial [Thermoplasmata archaeon]|nr:hypothetical protein [Thermoplasmata archaeon]
MSKGPTSHRESALPYQRRYLRTATALFATALMLGGGTLLLIGAASASPGMPMGGAKAPVGSSILTGSELAKSSFITKPGAPAS